MSEMELEGELLPQPPEDSASSTAYEGDISMVDSQGSVELSEALPSESETDADILTTPTKSPTPTPPASRLKFTPLSHSLRSSSGTQASRKRTLTDHRQQAELIQTQSRIFQLETEVLSLQCAAKRARIEEEGKTHEEAKSSGQAERLHKLEQERCEVLEVLSSTTEKLETALAEKSSRLGELTATCERDTRVLQEQLSEMRSSADSLRSENENLTARLVLLEQQVELEKNGLEEVRETYERSVESLKSRVQELETTESKLYQAEAKIQELERKRREWKQDYHFVEAVKSRVAQYGELERRNRLLLEENKTLREKSDNIELLRYRVQTLQEKCQRYEGQERHLVQLELENGSLRERVREMGGGGPTTTTSSTPALQCRIVELQQREVVLLRKQGELETKLKLAEGTAAAANEALSKTKIQLTKEQEASRNKDERVQRLEKKLLFVTKERDGCVNVLNSYRLDAGVDALLKENLTEMEQHLVRSVERITELESELELHAKLLEAERQRNLELCTALESSRERDAKPKPSGSL